MALRWGERLERGRPVTDPSYMSKSRCRGIDARSYMYEGVVTSLRQNEDATFFNYLFVQVLHSM